MSIIDALEELTATIRARGIDATMDPRDLVLPGAVVDLDRIGPDNTLCGDITATARVTLVVPDHGHRTSLRRLTKMYERLADLTTGADPVAWTLPDQGTMPGLTLTPIPLDL
ncbi:hypothetical protein [Corynebacterium kalidii]